MKKKFIRRACSGLLAAMLVFSAIYSPGDTAWAASTPKDVKGHWAQKYIEKAIDAGIVKGFPDGKFKPDEPVTRAEFCQMINSVLGNNATTAATFNDVNRSEWYYSAVSKAVAAGYVSGYANNRFKPNQQINRQEAAVMLSQVVPQGSSATLTKYPDNKDIESWARPAMGYMVGRGYIGTYTDGKLYPQDVMTRAQAATIISNVLTKEMIIKTDPNVTKDGARLAGAIYSNGITLSKNLDDGDATISNCVVLGTLNVSGGDEVTLDGCRVAQATFQRSSDPVKLNVRGDSSIKNATVSNEATIDTSNLTSGSSGKSFENLSIGRSANATLRGSFPKVTVDGSGAKVRLTSGRIETLNVTSAGRQSDITVDSGATVSIADVYSETYFHGNGTISRLQANASNITYEKKPNTIIVGPGGKNPDEGVQGLRITPDPYDGETGVDVDETIKLSFNNPIKLYGGSSISKSDIYDFVQFRERSSSGAKVPYTASIDSARKVITITPDDDLEDDLKYYIGISKNELKDSEGNANASFSTYFTTGDESSGYISFTPKNKASDVSISKDLIIKFSEKMVNYDDGSTISNSDLKNIVNFRRGSSSSSSKVYYSASIDSAKKVITITPDEKLDEDTTYYLAVNSKSVKTSSGSKTVPGESITFRTTGDESSEYCTFYPKNNASNVSRSIQPTVDFSEKMVRYSDKGSITSGNLEDIFTLRNTTRGKDVSFSASISSGRYVTIKPGTLEEGCKYTLSLNSRKLRTAEDNTIVPSASVSWTVTGGTQPSAGTPSISNNKDGKVTVSVYGNLAGRVYVVLVPGNAATPSASQVQNGTDASGNRVSLAAYKDISANSTASFDFTGLSPSTSYKVCSVLYANSTLSGVSTYSLTTGGYPKAVLSSLSVDGRSILDGSKTKYEVPVDFAASGSALVQLKAEIGSEGTIEFAGNVYKSSFEQPINVNNGSSHTATLTVNNARCDPALYEIVFTMKGNTELSSVTADVDSTNEKYGFAIPKDKDSAVITVVAKDSNATLTATSDNPSKLTVSGSKGHITLTANGAMYITVTVVSNNGTTDTHNVNVIKLTPPVPTSGGIEDGTSPSAITNSAIRSAGANHFS